MTKRSLLVAVALALVVQVVAATQPTSASTAAGERKVAIAQPSPRAGHYTPRPGVIFNNPLGGDRSRTINRHVRHSIDSAPAGSKIRIMSWNVKSDLYVRSIIRAHKRGVSVRLIMSNNLAEGQNAGGSFQRLKTALHRHQRHRPAGMKSWVRTCKASCRGWRGIAHVKFYVFSKAGRARNVVMVGSANMTEIAATNQWNDMFTVTRDPGLYNKFVDIFNEAALDRRAHPPYRTYRDSPSVTAWFLPYLGTGATGDPVLKILKRTRCNGATGRSGIKGKTAIRIAQTAILDERGVAIAHRLKRMYDSGCSIRLAYTVLGPSVRQILNAKTGRGPLPMSHIVQDFDDDGSYDRYLHMKVMTISGVYGNNTSRHLIYNGTQNWTRVSFDSDEAGFTIFRAPLERTYAAWINKVFENPPPNPNPRVLPGTPRKAPYSEVQLN